ncbi:MAG: YbhN family protein [Corynebacterium sp.]|nr:YbhN family protein [Corynebacterium sp.]
MRRKWLRFLGPLVLFAIVGFLLRDKMPFLAEGYEAVLNAEPLPILLAVIAVLLSIECMAIVMHRMLRYGGREVSLWHTSELTLISNSWSSTFPGGPAISTVYQFHTMRTWGIPPAIISWFIVVSGVLSTIWLMALGGFAIVFMDASIGIWRVVSMLVLMSVLILVIFAAINNTRTTSRIICGFVRRYNRLCRADSERWIPALHRHILQLNSVRMTPNQFRTISLCSLMNWVFDIISMGFCIWAVTGHIPGFERAGEIPSILGIVLAFVTTKIVGTAQITPAGIGPVEAAMTTSLVAVGMTASSAFGAVFVYRIFSFALVTIIGWVAYLISVLRGGARVLHTHVAQAESLPLH